MIKIIKILLFLIINKFFWILLFCYNIKKSIYLISFIYLMFLIFYNFIVLIKYLINLFTFINFNQNYYFNDNIYFFRIYNSLAYFLFSVDIFIFIFFLIPIIFDFLLLDIPFFKPFIILYFFINYIHLSLIIILDYFFTFIYQYNFNFINYLWNFINDCYDVSFCVSFSEKLISDPNNIKFIFFNSSKNNKIYNDICPICLNNLFLSNNNIVMMNCNHLIHKDCAILLLKKKYNYCPLCRKKNIF